MVKLFFSRHTMHLEEGGKNEGEVLKF